MLNTNSQNTSPLLSLKALSVSAGVFVMISVGAMSLVFAPHSSSSEVAPKKLPAASGAVLASAGYAVTGETDLSGIEPVSALVQSATNRELYLNPYVAQEPQFVDHAAWSTKVLLEVKQQEEADKPLYD